MNKLFYLLLGLLLLISLTAISQHIGGPPEPPGNVHGAGGDATPGGNAPIDGGQLVLFVFASLYITWKVFFKTKNYRLIKELSLNLIKIAELPGMSDRSKRYKQKQKPVN